jgi:hypothetical protein
LVLSVTRSLDEEFHTGQYQVTEMAIKG